MVVASLQSSGSRLTLSLPLPRWAGDNANLPSNSNISKTERVNIALEERFLNAG